MKTKLFTLLVIAVLCVPTAVLAHKPLLTVEDNDDGTIYVETGFSDGSSGSGHKIVLKNKETGEVLSETTIPEEGYIEELPIPNVPYTVTFDAGPGHMVVKDGPFSAEAAAAEEAEATEATEAQAEPETAVESQPETAAQSEPATPAAAPAAAQPAPQQPVQPVQQPVVVQPAPVQMPVMTTAPAATTMSPGMERALNMMMTSQMVSALAVLVVLGAVMFLLGYMLGKDAAKKQ